MSHSLLHCMLHVDLCLQPRSPTAPCTVAEVREWWRVDITSLFLHISTTDICVVVLGVPGGRRAWKRIFQTGKHNTENIGSCSTLILLSMAHSKDRGKTTFQFEVKSYKCHPLLLGMMSSAVSNLLHCKTYLLWIVTRSVNCTFNAVPALSGNETFIQHCRE